MARKERRSQRTARTGPNAGTTCRARASELRLLLLIVTTTLGVLVCGWVVSHLPTSFSAQAKFKRFFRPDIANVARTSEEIVAELITTPTIIALAEQNARITSELDPKDALTDLYSRLHADILTYDAGSDQVSIRVTGSSAAWSREIALRLVQAYVDSRKNSETYREHAANFAAAEARFQQAESEWNAAQASLRQLEAEQEFAQGDETSSRLQEIRTELDKVVALRDRYRRILSDPVLRMPVAPALVHPARAEPPTMVSAALDRYIQRREELAATYTAQHPAVISLDRKIAQLSAQGGSDDIQPVSGYAPASQVSVDRELLLRKISECEARLVGLAQEEAELAARVEGWQQSAEEHWQEQKQRAEIASRERLLAMHQMSKASDAIRNAERHQAVHYTLIQGDPAVRYEGWDRRKWYLAVLIPWLACMGLLMVLTIRRKKGSAVTTPLPSAHPRVNVFAAA